MFCGKLTENDWPCESGGCGGREKFSCGDQEGRKMNKSDKCCAL